jgi:hypothetical protein
MQHLNITAGATYESDATRKQLVSTQIKIVLGAAEEWCMNLASVCRTPI